ncbi:MAG: class B sortase [Candidatus Cohnella colombiensis]|uniref:Class B sortase n=1 Tax=Candidatus Cohnella colombiensis TaxID=3121368 RepID=A0AA95EZ13_9BACL|nr:MAG: class B sortase [Cohnella sp.]
MNLLRKINTVIVIRIVCVIMISYALYMVGSMLLDRSVNAQTYEDLRDLYAEDKQAAAIAVEETATPAPAPVVLHDVVEDTAMLPAQAAPHKEDATPENTFTNLRKANKDFVGWLHIKDTHIDYPVVQTTDNEYYLNHNFRKSENIGGAIFMDYRNKKDSKSSNTIIYGHHMKDDTMFTDLLKFADQEFYDEHPTFTFETTKGEQTWEIFSAYITNTSFNYIIPDFDTKKQFSDFISKVARKSLIKTDVKVSSSDQIMTLSTCSYSLKDGRMVVHARKIN